MIMSKKKKFVIIDGHALIHRAWHALPPTMTTRDGEVVNAVYGFALTLLKVLKDYRPEYLAVAFDMPKPTFRHEEYKEYKGTREKQADELYDQIPRIHELIEAFNVPIYEMEGYEADDVIATLVRDKNVEQIESIVFTGDMDLLQLVDDNTKVARMQKGISDTLLFDRDEVQKKFDGLTPEQIIDYKALRGDPSDNIPGVRGIGEKGAIALLNDFGTLEEIYNNLDSEKIKERTKKLLTESKKDALLSKKLVTLVDDVPIDFNLQDAAVDGYYLEDVLPLFQELQFKSLIAKLPKELQLDSAPEQSGFDFGGTREKVVEQKKHDGYILVNDEQAWKQFVAELKKQKLFALDTETSGLDPLTDALLGMSFSWKDGEAYYLPVAHGKKDIIYVKQKQIAEIKTILEDPRVHKVGHNIKFDLLALQSYGINLEGIVFDTMIASYLINPGTRQHSLDNLAFTEFGYQMQSITELIGKGKSQISLTEVALDKVAWYAAEDADYTWRLYGRLYKEIKKVTNLELLETIEVPLIPVLASMEREGILLDVDFMRKMGKSVTSKIQRIEKKVYDIAGIDFNLASPAQLKEVLFDRLQIPTDGLAKTKTGISTAASELEKLKGQHEIIDLIMEFRELSKLKSTYLDSLPKLVDSNSRVHTSYNQTVAATGRLSSSDPNLQNIPIRTELGREIRKGFIASRGKRLLSADYSQIELRVVASLAKDKKMIAAFKNKQDIHTTTAAEINNVSLDAVTKEMRYAAKAINFGIIYGQGPVGLAAVAGISRQQASEFIKKYFEIYSGVADFLEEVKEMARDKGYVETFFGRRRYVPEINASMPAMRAAAERAAINHPIQGTAADLLKLAMIEIHKKLAKVSTTSKMLLQVHDELLFEVPTGEVDAVAAFVQEQMQAVSELEAPVEVTIESGMSWGELH